MNMGGDKEFELNEVAAHTHTPPGWPIKSIEIVPAGKAPKKYGPATYRFSASLTLSVILPRRGWTLVKSTKNYAYLRPPPEQSTPPFKISIAIPTPDECLALARRSYARGQSWIGQLGEWPAWYLHERNTDVQEMSRDPATGHMVTRIHKGPPQSSLTIGQWGVWEANVTGVAGEFVIGILAPALAQGRTEAPNAPTSTLREGAPIEASLTVYERNPEARRRCIEHYGAKCQACGLIYEAKYGPIASGLIQVHHITPLSIIGATYEVDPIKDLVPLCATCHQVAHRRNPPYTIDELRVAIASQCALAKNEEAHYYDPSDN